VTKNARDTLISLLALAVIVRGPDAIELVRHIDRELEFRSVGAFAGKHRFESHTAIPA
jgi:hypothetical protein